MKAWRSLMIGTWCSCLCLTFWSSGALGLQSRLGIWEPTYLQGGLATLWLLQAILFTLWVPAYAGRESLLQLVVAISAACLFPLPLLTVAWLMGSISLVAIIAGQGVLLFFALGFLGLTLILVRSPLPVLLKEAVTFLLQGGVILVAIGALKSPTVQIPVWN
jgi:hypothetical protein